MVLQRCAVAGLPVPVGGGWRLDRVAPKLLTWHMANRPMLTHEAPALAREEAALLAQVAAGDRGAPLEELYRRYESRLYGLGLKLLGDQGLAEELVQETFVRLWRQAHRYDWAKGTVAMFLFAIARRLAIDLWRRPSSRPLAPIPTAEDSASTDPAEEIIEGLTIRDALQALTPEHRQMLELSYGQDRKQTEIAEELGLPVGTVKSRTYYALRQFKLALQERGIQERGVHA